jgi:hypothetical protein
MYGTDAKTIGSSEGAGPIPTTRKGRRILTRTVGWLFAPRAFLCRSPRGSICRASCCGVRSRAVRRPVWRPAGAIFNLKMGCRGETGRGAGLSLTFVEVNRMVRIESYFCELTLAAHYPHPIPDPTLYLLLRPLPPCLPPHVPTERNKALATRNL